MAIDLAEAGKIFAIGGVVGALGFYLLSKSGNLFGGAPVPATGLPQMTPVQTGGMPTTQVPTQMPGMASTMYASAYPAFGYDINGDDRWNNSEVWDTRNRTYFSDNILYNKLPYIELSAKQDFNPQFLPFSQGYDHGQSDQDSPRPRHGTHALDREIADEVYPRKTPLPYYF